MRSIDEQIHLPADQYELQKVLPEGSSTLEILKRMVDNKGCQESIYKLYFHGIRKVPGRAYTKLLLFWLRSLKFPFRSLPECDVFLIWQD